MKIDVGSGGYKRDGFVGIDVLPPGANNHDIDIVCDIETEVWPIEDGTASDIFSSHCFEHVKASSLPHIFQQMTRVAADGAKIEIWNPYAFHRDAFVLGHISLLTEELYYHICCGQQAGWSQSLGARWFLDEIRYHVDPRATESLADLGIPEDVAINHFNNIVKEFGVFITVDKSGHVTKPHWVFDRLAIDETTVYGGPPMRDSRDANRRLLTVGQYVPQLKREQAAQAAEAAQAIQAAEAAQATEAAKTR